MSTEKRPAACSSFPPLRRRMRTACHLLHSSLAGLVVRAGGLHPIPSRTRPLNSLAPMVLSLKAWKSRSLPGLPRTLLLDTMTVFAKQDFAPSKRPPRKGGRLLLELPSESEPPRRRIRGGIFVAAALANLSFSASLRRSRPTTRRCAFGMPSAFLRTNVRPDAPRFRHAPGGARRSPARGASATAQAAGAAR